MSDHNPESAFPEIPREFSGFEVKLRDDKIVEIEHDIQVAQFKYAEFYKKIHSYYLGFRNDRKDVLDEVAGVLEKFDLSVFDNIVDKIDSRLGGGDNELSLAFGVEKAARLRDAFLAIKGLLDEMKIAAKKVEIEAKGSNARMETINNIFNSVARLEETKKFFFNSLSSVRKDLTIH